MSKSLVIVESPAKAKTIENYLGKGFEVVASIGHIVDLPSKKLGVDIQHDFAPSYEIIEGKEKIVDKLKKAAASADVVYLASDPDREGEAIAWHINEQIKGKNKNIKRVEFNEITKQGVLEAIAHPGSINMNRVDAQQSRRILDRVVGYQVSPLLWKPLKYGLSAGRVQSVALRMVCEREEEIENFVTEESWTIDANFEVYEGAKKKGNLKATLDKKGGKKIELKKEADADAVIKDLEGETFKISSVEKKIVKSSAPMPFVTARLQQDSIRKLGFTAKKTMIVAQQLYEGISLGAAGAEGLITYMRTDSTRIAPEAAKAAADYINNTYGEAYLGKPKSVKAKANVQDAHEAIRPTLVTRTPDSIKSYLTAEQYKLYKLIWERFIASQMADAQYEQTTVLIDAKDYQFRASGRVMKFAGYTTLYMEAVDEDAKQEENPALLNVSGENGLKLENYDKKQHFTIPPPRFTEASIVRMLEQNGVGRPSTYASIISTIVEREYVEIKEKRIHPTELGRIVNKLLVSNFPNIFDIAFTANMEENLDKIESGESKWLKVLKAFYENFAKELQVAEKKFNVDLKVDMPCPECGKELMIKYGKNGSFIACSGYPECSFTSDFKRDENGKIIFVEREGPESTGLTCEKCGAEMVIKKSRYGEILACNAYPECKNIKNYVRLADGTIRVLDVGEKLGQKCPECKEGDVVLKSGKNGLFAACSNYPKCKYTASVEADDSGKLIVKENKVESMGECEKCGRPMIIKKSFRGPFLACSGYPECKNTKSLKAAQKEASGDVPVKKSSTKAEGVSKKSSAKTEKTDKKPAVKKSASTKTASEKTKKTTTKKSTKK